MSPSGAWRGEGRTDLQRSPFSWMQRLGLIPVQREAVQFRMGSAMGIPGCGLCPHGRSRRRRWIPAQPGLHYKPVGCVVWYSRSGQVPSLQCRGAGSALAGSSLLRRCSVELQPRAPATCRGWRYRGERRHAGSWDCEWRRFVGGRASLVRTVLCCGLRAAQSGRGGERYELSHWCDERVGGELPPYGSTVGINGRCAGATAYAGGGAGDRIGGDGRVGGWRSWEWEEKERDESFLDRLPKLQAVDPAGAPPCHALAEVADQQRHHRKIQAGSGRPSA